LADESIHTPAVRHKIITQYDAIEKGLRTYFTGVPCAHGHISVRYTANNTCADCFRMWAEQRTAKSPGVKKAAPSKQKTPIKTLALVARRVALATPANDNACVTSHGSPTGASADKEGVLNRKAERGKKAKRRAAALAKGLSVYNKGYPCIHGHTEGRYTLSNLCVTCATRSMRRVRGQVGEALVAPRTPQNDGKLKKLPRKFSPPKRTSLPRKAQNSSQARRNLLNQIFVHQGGRCAACRKRLKKYHQDHIIPLSKGGEDIGANIQLLCPKCNGEKSNKDPLNYMQEQGFLL